MQVMRGWETDIALYCTTVVSGGERYNPGFCMFVLSALVTRVIDAFDTSAPVAQ